MRILISFWKQELGESWYNKIETTSLFSYSSSQNIAQKRVYKVICGETHQFKGLNVFKEMAQPSHLTMKPTINKPTSKNFPVTYT
jgi:hypothetical protein